MTPLIGNDDTRTKLALLSLVCSLLKPVLIATILARLVLSRKSPALRGQSYGESDWN